MILLQYRVGMMDDVPAMAKIRSLDWESEEYWRKRIAAYMAGNLHPRQALPPRATFVATDGDRMVGFIAGHLTERLGCKGELEWLNVIPEYRRKGVASGLLQFLASWFAAQDANSVCVDVAEDNVGATRFYRALGAKNLNPHWLFWEDIRIVREGRNCI